MDRPAPATGMEDAVPVPVVSPTESPRLQREPPPYNRAIQGLRGFAALGVVVFHLPLMAPDALMGLFPAGRAMDLFNASGKYYVCLFFCISGFLIVQSLVRQGSVRKFARNRAARIYPLFGLLTVLIFALGPFLNYRWMGPLRHDPAAWALNFLSNLFFLPGVFDLPLAQHVAWSLSYEASFYVLAALGYVALRPGRWSPLAIGAGALALAGAVALGCLRPLSLYFLVGIVCYAGLDRLSGTTLRIPKVLGLLCLLAGLVAYSANVLFALPLVLIVFATLVMQEGWLSAFLATKPLNYLGRISFSLYLVHPLALDAMRRVSGRLVHPMGQEGAFAIFGVLGVVLAVALADLSHRWIEVGLTNRLFPRKPRAA